MTSRPRARRVAAAIRRMPLSAPFSPARLEAALAAATATPVTIVSSATLPPSVAGRWYRDAAGVDVIEYADGLPEIARMGTILHEAGHILCGHTRSDEQLEFDVGLCTIVGRDAVANFAASASVLHRSVYRTRFEQEAELYARRALDIVMHSEPADDIAARVRRALGHPRGVGW
jgi:hypothetical protein